MSATSRFCPSCDAMYLMAFDQPDFLPCIMPSQCAWTSALYFSSAWPSAPVRSLNRRGCSLCWFQGMLAPVERKRHQDKDRHWHVSGMQVQTLSMLGPRGSSACVMDAWTRNMHHVHTTVHTPSRSPAVSQESSLSCDNKHRGRERERTTNTEGGKET